MATLYLRKGQYYINYCVNGRRIRRSVGTNKSDAELHLKEIKFRLYRGDFRPERPVIPIAYAVKQFLQHCQTRSALSTCNRYRSALGHFLDYTTYTNPILHINQLNSIVIAEYTNHRLNSSPKPKQNTINKELCVVRTLLNFSVESGYLEKNPVGKIRLFKGTDAKKGCVLNPEEINKILSVSDSWFAGIFLFFLNTGMRLGELVHLTWEDVTEDFIEIQPKEDWNPKSYSRSIPLNKTARKILHTQPHTHKYCFTYKGKKIPNNKLRKELIKYSRMVGLPYITRIHDLRHTFCSNLLMKNVDVPTVSALLGHQSIKTTLIYSHRTSEHSKKAVESLV